MRTPPPPTCVDAWYCGVTELFGSTGASCTPRRSATATSDRCTRCWARRDGSNSQCADLAVFSLAVAQHQHCDARCHRFDAPAGFRTVVVSSPSLYGWYQRVAAWCWVSAAFPDGVSLFMLRRHWPGRPRPRRGRGRGSRPAGFAVPPLTGVHSQRANEGTARCRVRWP
jgi:hypothetical protein